MQFTSSTYLIFLPLVFILYWLLPSRLRWVLLLASSAVFYLSWTQVYFVLIVITTLTTYLAGRLMEDPKHHDHRKVLLLVGILVPLGQLFFFKYTGFFVSIMSDLKSLITGTGLGSFVRLMLPVGISFYTFQTVGYVVDVYKGTMIMPCLFHSFLSFSQDRLPVQELFCLN
jgi:alginate O-acetyltransferase complex protein AlgI